MAEKRKADLVILLKNKGKSKANKVEIFNSEQWRGPKQRRPRGSLFRLRVNGKWYTNNGRKYFYKTEIMRLLSNSIRF